MPQTLYLEDLPGLRFKSRAETVAAEKIVAFAREFDPQPFHTDADAARQSLFGGLVASGWHTAALTMRLIVENLPIAGGVVGAGGEAEWPRPVYAGDRLHVEGEVLDIAPSRSKPDRGIATVRAETKNQDGETVQILTARLLVFRRP